MPISGNSARHVTELVPLLRLSSNNHVRTVVFAGAQKNHKVWTLNIDVELLFLKNPFSF